MDDKNQGKKPLRSTSNKIKDIYDTYVKNDGGRTIPIHDTDEESIKNEQISDNDEEMNEENTNDTQDNLGGDNTDSHDDSISKEEAYEALNNEINKLQAEKEELKDQLIRKAAELENIRRRSIKEKQELLEFGNEKLLSKLLEIPDNLKNALDAAERNPDFESLKKGLELIYKTTTKLFESEGVKPMDDPTGNEFDVDYHDALMAQDSELPENHIVQVAVPGYMIKDKVLRHAKVITSTGNKPENQ